MTVFRDPNGSASPAIDAAAAEFAPQCRCKYLSFDCLFRGTGSVIGKGNADGR
jgi:hypothetical protein